MKQPALTSGLVAIKGAAAPAPDMPARGATLATAKKEANLEPLNFRVSASFRTEFKTYAAAHDLKLNELLRLAFDAYRKQRGD